MVDKKRVFISYGRKESLHFAKRLYRALEQEGIHAWFDFENIPKGEDFQKRIDDGIESADNFIFIMSPHALQSNYCKKELSTAARLNKRIIPIAHIEVPDNDTAWQPIHKITIKKLNWINFREKNEVGISQKDWASIDDFDTAFHELQKVLSRQANYVALHTNILHAALHWDRKRRMHQHLLAGPELFEASEWLEVEFKAPEQPPCLPTDLHCEFICESIKNANNLMTNVFMISASWKAPYRDFIRLALARNKITTWQYASAMQAGMEEHQMIKEGIEGADNILFLVSQENITSEKCLEELKLAFGYHKRIIPIIIGVQDTTTWPEELKNLSYIDFAELDLKSDKDLDVYKRKKQVDLLVKEIDIDEDYFFKHKQLLTRALKWRRMDKNDSFLIRGYNLSEAQTWLQEGLTRHKYKPNKIHQEFLTASEAKVGVLQSEVFISYSQKNADFARKLNLKLQTFGKNTWFDQESLVGASNFEEEILKGIAASENFIFIISPQSVASEFCAKEVAHAYQLKKRFIPILLEETSAEQIPSELKGIQWVDFKHKTFDTAFGRLIQAINIDRAYVQQHTRLLQAALEWEDKGKSPDRLVRGEELNLAEHWLDDALENKREPIVTALQRSFIRASEELRITEEKKEISVRNLRRILRLSAFAVLAAIIIVLAYQFNQARTKELEASEKAALNYAFAAREVLNTDHAPKRALSIIKEAVNIINEGAIYKLLPFFRDISMSLNYEELPHNSPVLGVDALVAKDHKLLLSFTESEVKVWDTTGILLHSIDAPYSSISDAGFSPDKRRIYIEKENKEIELIELTRLQRNPAIFVKGKINTKNKFSEELKANDYLVDFQFFDKGSKILTVYKNIAARVWTANGGWLYTLNHTGARINGASISNDDKLVLTYSQDRTAKLWNVSNAQQDIYQATLRGHNQPIIYGEISSDRQKALTLDASGNAKVWDISILKNPKELRTYVGVAQMHFTKAPDLLVMRRQDMKVQLEDLKGAFFSELMTYKQFNAGIDSIQLTAHRDMVLTYTNSGSAALWKLNGQLVFEMDVLEDGASIDQVAGDYSMVDKVLLSPSGQYFLKTDRAGEITVWHTETGSELASLKVFQAPIQDVFFLSGEEQQIMAASLDNTAKTWHFTHNLFDHALSEKELSEPRLLKANINTWLDSLDTDSLKMAAKDKIRIGLMDDFTKIASLKDSAELYTYAYYYKKEAEGTPETMVKNDNYQKALELFSKINNTTGYNSIYSEVAEADILFELNATDTLDFNSFFAPQNLSEQLYLAQYITQKWTRSSIEERIPAYQFIFDLYNSVLEKLNSNGYDISEERKMIIKRRAADNCNSLAYYHLLGGKLAKCIDYAEKGIAIDSTYEWILTKLALAHLYDANFDKALPLLEKMKGQKFGVDAYEREMQRYIEKVDSAYKAKNEEKSALPLSFSELINIHRKQLSPEQLAIINAFLPKK